MMTDCKEWTEGRNGGGYGQFRRPGSRRVIKTHRFAWELEFGPIPDGLYVLHKCDNPPCCNIAHLFLGTPKDNAQDAKSKGRLYRPTLEDQRKGHAKLSLAEVAEIRKLIGSKTQKEIAKRFKVHQSTVSFIKTGRYWKEGS